VQVLVVFRIPVAVLHSLHIVAQALPSRLQQLNVLPVRINQVVLVRIAVLRMFLERIVVAAHGIPLAVSLQVTQSCVRKT
jgi:hypothetical protein